MKNKNSNWYRVYAGKYVHSIGGRTDRFTIEKQPNGNWLLTETATGRTCAYASLKTAKAGAAEWMAEEHQKWLAEQQNTED